MDPIEPCLQAEYQMERVRRAAQDMSREELLICVDALSRLYATTKAGCNWLAKQTGKSWG